MHGIRFIRYEFKRFIKVKRQRGGDITKRSKELRTATTIRI